MADPVDPQEGDPAPPSTPPAAADFRAPTSQEDFDRMIGPRLERERQKFAGFEDYKAKADQFDELQRQNESEVERLRREAEEANQRAEAASWTAAGTVVRSAVIAEASKAGAVDPEAVFALLDSNAVTIDDAGRVTGAEAAVQQLLTDKPYLKASQSPPSFDGGARGDGTGQNGSVRQYTREELKGLSPERISELREGGHLDLVLGINRS